MQILHYRVRCCRCRSYVSDLLGHPQWIMLAVFFQDSNLRRWFHRDQPWLASCPDCQWAWREFSSFRSISCIFPRMTKLEKRSKYFFFPTNYHREGSRLRQCRNCEWVEAESPDLKQTFLHFLLSSGFMGTKEYMEDLTFQLVLRKELSNLSSKEIIHRGKLVQSSVFFCKM